MSCRMLSSLVRSAQFLTDRCSRARISAYSVMTVLNVLINFGSISWSGTFSIALIISAKRLSVRGITSSVIISRVVCQQKSSIEYAAFLQRPCISCIPSSFMSSRKISGSSVFNKIASIPLHSGFPASSYFCWTNLGNSSPPRALAVSPRCSCPTTSSNPMIVLLLILCRTLCTDCSKCRVESCVFCIVPPLSLYFLHKSAASLLI